MNQSTLIEMASRSGLSEMSLRKFNGTNFNFWKGQMQDYVIVRGQINHIKNQRALEEYKPNEWTKFDLVVDATIRMNMSKSVYYTI